MGTLRVLPPPSGTQSLINGRTFRYVPGTPQDVDDFDALVLKSNGWQVLEPHGSGVTAARPINPNRNTRFFDATLGVTVIWDGFNWRNLNTGAVA